MIDIESVQVQGAKRTGTTILQNISHLILTGQRGVVKKHHFFMATDARVLVAIRDPRDVVLSLRRTVVNDYNEHNPDRGITDLDFLDQDVVARQLQFQEQLYLSYKDNPKVLILRYENIWREGLGNYQIVTKALCDFLEVQYTGELQELVDSELALAKLKKISDTIGTFRLNDTMYNPRWDHRQGRSDYKEQLPAQSSDVLAEIDKYPYHLHGNHIGTLKILKWPTEVPVVLHGELSRRLSRFIVNLEYGL